MYKFNYEAVSTMSVAGTQPHIPAPGRQSLDFGTYIPGLNSSDSSKCFHIPIPQVSPQRDRKT